MLYDVTKVRNKGLLRCTVYIIAQFIHLVRVRINKCSPSALYSVTSTLQCTLYTVQCTLCTVQCTLYSRSFVVEGPHMKLYNVWSFLSKKCKFFNV